MKRDAGAEEEGQGGRRTLACRLCASAAPAASRAIEQPLSLHLGGGGAVVAVVGRPRLKSPTPQGHRSVPCTCRPAAACAWQVTKPNGRRV